MIGTLKQFSIFLELICLLIVTSPIAAETDDEKAIKATIGGYVNIFYNVDHDLADKIM